MKSNIVVFFSNQRSDFQTTIDNWLQQIGDVNIVSVSQCPMTDGGTGAEGVLITIAYEKPVKGKTMRVPVVGL
jgi:hypothetical protein